MVRSMGVAGEDNYQILHLGKERSREQVGPVHDVSCNDIAYKCGQQHSSLKIIRISKKLDAFDCCWHVCGLKRGHLVQSSLSTMFKGFGQNVPLSLQINHPQIK